MIIFLEATNMIIKRLEIKNLHGIYNYNVSFNDDLTFIFGENGCGKTTILDIVSSIVMLKMWEKNMNMKKYLKDSLKTI